MRSQLPLWEITAVLQWSSTLALLFFIFITGDTQLLNYPPFKIALSLQLIPAFPSLTSETATILKLFPASHTFSSKSFSWNSTLYKRAFLLLVHCIPTHPVEFPLSLKSINLILLDSTGLFQVVFNWLGFNTGNILSVDLELCSSFPVNDRGDEVTSCLLSCGYSHEHLAVI